MYLNEKIFNYEEMKLLKKELFGNYLFFSFIKRHKKKDTKISFRSDTKLKNYLHFGVK